MINKITATLGSATVEVEGTTLHQWSDQVEELHWRMTFVLGKNEEYAELQSWGCANSRVMDRLTEKEVLRNAWYGDVSALNVSMVTDLVNAMHRYTANVSLKNNRLEG